MSEAGAQTIRRAHAVQPLTALQSEYSLWWRDPGGRDHPGARGARHRLRPVQPAGQGIPHRHDRRRRPTFEAGDFRNAIPRFADGGARGEPGARRPARPDRAAAGRHPRPDRAGMAARAEAVDRPDPGHPQARPAGGEPRRRRPRAHRHRPQRDRDRVGRHHGGTGAPATPRQWSDSSTGEHRTSSLKGVAGETSARGGARHTASPDAIPGQPKASPSRPATRLPRHSRRRDSGPLRFSPTGPPPRRPARSAWPPPEPEDRSSARPGPPPGAAARSGR